MTVFKLSFQSLINRKSSFILTSLLISISVFLVLGLERIRLAARDSFQNTISQVDLVVGARTSPLNLILYSVFRIGDASNNVSYETFEKYAKDPRVQFVIPISLGDSHKSFRVLGTTTSFFQNYKYAGNKALSFQDGKEFQNTLDAVIGSDVAKKLNYKLGDKITLSHGTDAGIHNHDDQEFVVVGILNPTFTPVDKTVHVNLSAIEAIHVGWESGVPDKSKVLDAKAIEEHDHKHDEHHEHDGHTDEHSSLEPKSITAFFVGLKSRQDVFELQNVINKDSSEPLTAALPGAVLFDLWKTLSYVETTLFIFSTLVFISSLVSLFLILLTNLNQRRREMSILRSLGATPGFILKLYLVESIIITLTGYLVGVGSIFILRPLIKGIVSEKFGVELNISNLSLNDLYFTISIIAASITVSLIPAMSAYKKSVSDGLTARV